WMAGAERSRRCRQPCRDRQTVAGLRHRDFPIAAPDHPTEKVVLTIVDEDEREKRLRGPAKGADCDDLSFVEIASLERKAARIPCVGIVVAKAVDPLNAS